MNGTPTTVLLAGYAGIESAVLCRWLARHDCHCQFAASFEDVRKILSQAEFDLVLCDYALPDRTAFPLLEWLDGTHSTLFFSSRHGDKNRWLPVIDRGQRCLDRPLLETSELPNALGSMLAGKVMRVPLQEIKGIPREVNRVRETPKENRL
jgi:CheY-like chemotaxis protein